jgi:N-acyl-D-aspartate/D-glutamate deacylase
MAKQTITAIITGNCGAGSDYNNEERERLKNKMIRKWCVIVWDACKENRPTIMNLAEQFVSKSYG